MDFYFLSDTMPIQPFLIRLRQFEPVSFSETMSVISEHYDYHPCEFSNGLGDETLVNPAGSNEGSCKIFAFAMRQHLDQAKTLHLFGDYFYRDVLENPHGDNHKNIRNFMKYGWEGICFSQEPLSEK